MGWDDTLDVWGVHGIGGVLGIICLGIVANTAFNPAGTDGLLLGSAKFFGLQVLAVSAWAFVFTYGMLWLINKITIVRVAKGVEEKGLDQMLHGELTYEEMAG